MRFWRRLVSLLIIGYMCDTRSFAHLGLAPLHLFIGEIALGMFLFWRYEEAFSRLLDNAAAASWLQGFSLAYLTAFSYGLVEVFRGILSGYRPIAIVEDFAFHIYPLYLFLGLWVGQKNPRLLRRLVRQLAWVNGIYGLLFIAVLSHWFILMPGTHDTLLFSQPNSSALIVLALLSFEPDLTSVAHLVVINAFVALGMEVRAEFLSLIVGLALWGILTRNIGRVIVGVAAVGALLAIGYVTDVSIPAPATRGGKISARYIIGRSLSTIDTEAATQYTPEARTYEGTYKWRARWWKAIWQDVNANATTAALGEGTGFTLSHLVTYINDPSVRTPHDIFFYCLGYEGWIGVALFALMQAALAAGFWRLYVQTGQSYGVVMWVMCLVSALFSNYFETPFGAIPFYLLSGLILAPVQRWSTAYESLAGAQLLSAARG